MQRPGSAPRSLLALGLPMLGFPVLSLPVLGLPAAEAAASSGCVAGRLLTRRVVPREPHLIREETAERGLCPPFFPADRQPPLSKDVAETRARL